MSAPSSNHERECKLDAPNDAVIADAKNYVLSNPDIFAPSLHQDRPGIPKKMRALFGTPFEVTEPRVRLYWDDCDLTAYKAGIEMRQEPRPKGGIKQMIKINAQDDGKNGNVLSRMEHSANLDHFGVDLDAIKDSDIRHRLKKQLRDCEFKPILCMVSQRTRLNYHPEGRADILIELGFDAPCWGYGFDGFEWQIPQIELELLNGPTTDADVDALMRQECARLSDRFDLTPDTTSKPSRGFAHLKGVLETEKGRKAFDSLKSEDIWWA